MCELLGVCAVNKMQVNDLLKEFYSHSDQHPNGWGLAIFHGDVASLEKEPVKATQSAYLRERLRHKIEVRTMIAHIRLATVGSMEYENCHPFVQQDNCGHRWTLAHNGTMFHAPVLSPYFYVQEGRTDSERILCCLIDRVNQRQSELGRPLETAERFALVDSLVCELAPGNKLNFLLYDGELMYVHTNYAGTLYLYTTPQAAVFATRPLGNYPWREMPFTTLCAYREGKRVFTGTNHHSEYLDNEQDLKYLFLDNAGL